MTGYSRPGTLGLEDLSLTDGPALPDLVLAPRRLIRVIIVAPYAATRAGLHSLLEEADGIAVIGEVCGSADLARLVPELRPDIVVFDDNPGDRSRVIEAVEETGTGLIVLAENDSGYEGLMARHMGAWGYLHKDADGRDIASAIRAVAAGLVVLARTVAASLFKQTQAEQSGPRIDSSFPEDILTAREREVLQLMASGLPNKVIAVRLSISLHTVKFHVASILSKLAATSRTEAVTIGARHGLVLL